MVPCATCSGHRVLSTIYIIDIYAPNIVFVSTRQTDIAGIYFLKEEDRIVDMTGHGRILKKSSLFFGSKLLTRGHPTLYEPAWAFAADAPSQPVSVSVEVRVTPPPNR